MNFGIIIQARTGSTRFPKKVLQKIDHRSVLEYLIDSLLKVFPHNEIIIATTILKRDNKIKLIAQKKKVKIFCGSENNVLKRYLECLLYIVLIVIHQLNSCLCASTILISVSFTSECLAAYVVNSSSKLETSKRSGESSGT